MSTHCHYVHLGFRMGSPLTGRPRLHRPASEGLFRRRLLLVHLELTGGTVQHLIRAAWEMWKWGGWRALLVVATFVVLAPFVVLGSHFFPDRMERVMQRLQRAMDRHEQARRSSRESAPVSDGPVPETARADT